MKTGLRCSDVSPNISVWYLGERLFGREDAAELVFFDDLAEGSLVVVVAPLFDGEGLFVGAVDVVPGDEFLARGVAIFVELAYFGGFCGVFDLRESGLDVET